MDIQKKVVISGVVLLLLVGASFLSVSLEKETNKIASGLFFQEFDVESIHTISVGDSSSGVTLTKENGLWRVTPRGSSESYITDQVKVETLLDKVLTMRKDQLVSDKAANQEVLGVTTEAGISLSLSSDDETFAFIVGNKNANWRLSNVRIEGDNSVYLVSGSIRFAFKTELENWRDKKLFDHPSDSIESINILDIITLYRDRGIDFNGEQWYVRRGDEVTRANSDMVTQYLRSITTLTATDWADRSLPETVWNSNGGASVDITMKDGSVERFTVGASDVSGRSLYYFKNSGREDLYLVTRSGAEIPFITYEFLTYDPSAHSETPEASESNDVDSVQLDAVADTSESESESE